MGDMLGNVDGFQVPAMLHTLTWRVDRSVHVVFETNELTWQSKCAMAKMHLDFGTLAFAKDAGDIIKLPKVSTPNPKSHSQRLRDVLFRLWEQEGQPGRAEEYYAAEMERVIATYRRRLV